MTVTGRFAGFDGFCGHGGSGSESCRCRHGLWEKRSEPVNSGGRGAVRLGLRQPFPLGDPPLSTHVAIKIRDPQWKLPRLLGHPLRKPRGLPACSHESSATVR